jgi:hypothetical protein
MLPLILIFAIEENASRIIQNINYLSIILVIVSSVFLAISGLNERISLRVIFWFYTYVFMAAVPLFQIYYNAWRYRPAESLITLGIVLIIIGSLFFELGYRLSRVKLRSRVMGLRQIEIKKWTIMIYVVLTITIIATLINGFDISSSIVRRLFGNTYSPIENIVEFTLRPSIFFLTILLIFYFKCKNVFGISSIGKIFLVILIIFLLINPFSGARSLIFFLYFGLFFIIYKDKLLNIKFFFVYFLFLGILGSQLQEELRRNFTLGSQDADSATTLDYIFGGSFDGFENTIHTIAHLSEYGSTYGYQLIGAILFFIPRHLWPTKPTGSGEYLSDNYISNYFEIYFTNIATPLISEIIINTHYLIAPLLMYLVGKICAKIDFTFKNNINITKRINYVTGKVYVTYLMLFYPVSLGAFFFMLRGDLMTSLSFIVGLLISSYFIFIFSTSRISRSTTSLLYD